MTVFTKLMNMIPWLKRDCGGYPCSDQEGLRHARRQDMAGNYDIDGVSFDGEALYMSGRIDDSQSFHKPLVANQKSK